MYPILIHITSKISIHTYGFLLALGVLLGIFVCMHLAKKAGLDRVLVYDFIFYSVLIGLLGAKLWLFVTEIKFYLSDPSQIPTLITAAGSFYGGLIFGALFVVWFVRRHKLAFKKVADVLTPGVAIAHFFGRMGCFAAGCCWGREADNCKMAVTFSSPDAETGVPKGIPLYPTQVMEAVLNLINFIILLIVYKKKKFDGMVTVVYIFNYSIIRFIVEYFRGDTDRGYIIGNLEHPFTSISVPQLVSIIGVIIAIILYNKFKKQALASEK